MEYISREEAIDKMRSLKSRFRAKNDWDSGYDTAIAEAFEHIKRVPAADVQPVKHSRWISTNDGTFNAYCENCGQERGSKAWNKNDFKYCFGCGARMDGDDDDDEE